MGAPSVDALGGAAARALAPLLAGVVDTLAWPLLLLRRDGTLLHANAAAQRLLRQGQPLQLARDRQVRPADGKRAAAFDAALRAAAAGKRRMLHWAGESGALTATVTPMPVASEPAAQVLVVLTSGEGSTADTAAFAAAHGLSATETQVLQRLARGDSSSRAAAALCISVATVRSRIASMRAKTGHASVAQLVRTLAHLPPLATPGRNAQGE